MSKNTVYNLISSYAPEIDLRLHTPAHQGTANGDGYFPEKVYLYDRPYLTPDKLVETELAFSRAYGSRQTFFLTGGTTQGVLATCSALARRCSRVALGRNCHVSFINGIILTGLEPMYIPSAGAVPTAAEVLAGLEGPASGAGAVVLADPCYEGFRIDLAAVVSYCRQRGSALIVDEAHGTHFPFTAGAPESALVTGGDIVLHSLHKYLGSFVQTGLLHLPENSLLSPEELRSSLELFESTTRSNLLVLSIEEALERAFSPGGRELFSEAARRCELLREKIRPWGSCLSFRESSAAADPLKLFLTSDRAEGNEIGDLFYSRRIDNELCNAEGTLFLFSLRNGEEDFSRFSAALNEVHNALSVRKPLEGKRKSTRFNLPKMRRLPREAFFAARQTPLQLGQAIGRINCSNYVKCPPGIPALIPGEEITAWHLEVLPKDMPIRVLEE